MDHQDKLLNDLKSNDSGTRKKATQALWKLWYEEVGQEAATQLNQGAVLIDEKKLDQAENLFFRIIGKYPSFAEAHNKLATIFYLRGNYAKSVEECQTTLRMNPVHFGAWNGLGLCFFNLGQYPKAIQCFNKALEIQPFAKINRIYIARCRGNLN